MVSATGDSGLVVSHLPVIVEDNSSDPDASDLACMRDDAADAVVGLGHLAKTDTALHQLGQHPVVLIVQGPHGYLSPSWYLNGPHIPTWDFVVAHLHGRPAVLTTDGDVRCPGCHGGPPRSRPIETVATGRRPGLRPSARSRDHWFRLRPDRVVGKAKLHQDEHPAEALHLAAVLEAAADPGVTPAQQLASALRRANTPPTR